MRAVFVRQKSCSGSSEKESVNQFFHILSSVAMPKGCVMTKDGKYEYTRYTSCCNTDKGIYYYATYESRTIAAIDLYSVDLDTSFLYQYDYVDA